MARATSSLQNRLDADRFTRDAAAVNPGRRDARWIGRNNAPPRCVTNQLTIRDLAGIPQDAIDGEDAPSCSIKTHLASDDARIVAMLDPAGSADKETPDRNV
jgi:hypothetical protein